MILPHAQGATLAVRAQPGAKKNAIVGEQAGALKVSVTAPAQDGRANEALIELLAAALKLRRSQFTLLNGATNRNKVFLVEGVSAELLQELVNTAMP